MRHALRVTAAASMAALTLAAAGCGDDDSGAITDSMPATVATAPAGPAAGSMLRVQDLSPNVGDLLADTTGEPLVAAGYLFVDPDGSARLCNGIAQSRPPQCGGTTIPVENLPRELVDGLESQGGLRWSQGLVQLMGTVENGVFTNDPELLAAS